MIGNDWGHPPFENGKVDGPRVPSCLRDSRPARRGAAGSRRLAWALGQMADAEARHALDHALAAEADDLVRREIQMALGDPTKAEK